MKRLATYCPSCDREVDAEVRDVNDTIVVRGDETPYAARVAVCPCCGEVIADSRLESGNLESAYAAYRAAHGIMGPSEIRSTREAYGLSVRDFSRFLGFGEQTVARYESGALPDESHAATLRMSASRLGASALLEARGDELPRHIVEAASRFIGTGGLRGPLAVAFAQPSWPSPSMLSPTRLNGYRSTDPDRVASAVVELAGRCRSLFVTKLQKAMFFLDFYSFGTTSRSMTGMAYAHANYGPVMEMRERVMAELVDAGAVTLEQDEWGEIVRPGASGAARLPERDLGVIATVSSFVDTFSTARELSDFSHGLDAWRGTASGELISYPENAAQVVAAVDARLAGARG